MNNFSQKKKNREQSQLHGLHKSFQHSPFLALNDQKKNSIPIIMPFNLTKEQKSDFIDKHISKFPKNLT